VAQPKDAAKAAIVEAAWRVVDRQGVVQLLAGVSLRDIADEIGISASTISYHFDGQEGLAWAMIESLVDARDLEPLRALTEVLRAEPGTVDPSELVRGAAQADWDELSRPESATFERRLMRVLAATGSDADGERITARLRDGVWEEYLGPFTELLDAVCETQHRHFVEPFTSREISRVSMATAERLLHQSMLDPDAIRGDLLADSMVAFFSAVLAPDTVRLGIDELESSMQVLEPHDGADPELIEWRRRVAEAAAPLFTGPANQVSLTDVATAAGVPVRAIRERFRGATEVAAVSAYRFLPELRVAVERRLSVDVHLALADYLCEIARLARIEPAVWGALGLERQRAALAAGPDVHDDVPLDLIVEAGLAALGIPVSDQERADLSRLVVDTALSYSLTRPTVAPHTVAALAMRLIPHEG